MNKKHETDFQRKDVIFEVKTGLNSIRGLRDALLQLVYAISGNKSKQGVLVLTDSLITASRIMKEWDKAKNAFRPEIVSRMNIVTLKNGNYDYLLKNPDKNVQTSIDEILLNAKSPENISLPKPDYYYELLKIMIRQWLLGKGPMTADWLSKAAGCSYPTVARAKERLGSGLISRSDRKIELARFPDEEWAKLLFDLDKLRSTVRYEDKSGQPRSPEKMLSRFAKLKLRNIAVGGVIGSKHYYPDLDLVGVPRLDLSVHCHQEKVNLDFVEQLDPALERIDNNSRSASLVIHIIRRKSNFFEESKQGTLKESLLIADPVECLQDLHEMRLEPQAKDFLRSFDKVRTNQNG